MTDLSLVPEIAKYQGYLLKILLKILLKMQVLIDDSKNKFFLLIFFFIILTTYNFNEQNKILVLFFQ